MLKRLLALALIVALLIPAVAFAADLKFGDKGNEVLHVQERLYMYNYYNNGFDGLFGTGTLSAVRAFQTNNALPVTGVVDSATLAALNSTTAVAKPAASTGSTRTLKYNDKGQDVLNAQQRLVHYGYYNGALDGIFGSGMQTAVRRFQQNNLLVVDGKIGPTTRALLYSDSAKPYTDPVYSDTLQRGSYGQEVVELQQQLNLTYYYTGALDGVFGTNVESAVKAFQSSTGLTSDGKVGPTTYNALFNRSASIFNGGIPRRSLSSGMRGWDVYVLQQKLVNINYMSAIVTPGYYDSSTVSAVTSFQKDNGLEADGKVCSVVRRYIWPSTVDKEDVANKDALDGNGTYVAQRTLRKGSSGADVSNAQMRLKAAGFLLGNADGVYGDSTVKAVKQLQKYFGLQQDGVIGPTTWSFINVLNIENAEPLVVLTGKKAATTPISALRSGTRNSNVAKLQAELASVGLLSESDVDGIFGSKTKAAVMTYQKNTLLSIDGVAGSQTLATINDQLKKLTK